MSVIRSLLKEKLIWGLDISSPALSSDLELSVHINENAKKVVSQFYVDSDGNLVAVEEEARYVVPVEDVKLVNGDIIVTY